MRAEASKLHALGRGDRLVWLALTLVFLARVAWAAADVCHVCKKGIESAVFLAEDKVTRARCFLCGECARLTDICYLCGLPVRKDFRTLTDGRVICQRDVAAVVIEEAEALRICDQVKDELDRQFIRSLTLPTNVTVRLMDRLNLQELFKVIGHDNSCPNVLGCAEAKTNGGQRSFEISVLSGLLREDLMTTCVHEYAHTWAIENLSAARNQTIGKDAVEGFCELLSFLYAEQKGLAAGRSNILANRYTRGQVQHFIAATRFYGFQDVVDWMQRGQDRILVGEDLGRVRLLEDAPAAKPTAPRPPVVNASPAASAPPRLPDKLTLKAITGSKARPLAIINDQNFAARDVARVRLAAGNPLVRCLEIRERSVLIRFEESGATEELKLPESPPR